MNNIKDIGRVELTYENYLVFSTANGVSELISVIVTSIVMLLNIVFKPSVTIMMYSMLTVAIFWFTNLIISLIFIDNYPFVEFYIVDLDNQIEFEIDKKEFLKLKNLKK